MGETAEQPDNSRGTKAEHLQPYQFKKGQSGNPSGRKPGKSLKEYAKEMLASMTDEERQEYLQGIDKKTIWEMAESKPSQGIGQAEDLKELHINLIKFDDNSDTTPQPTT